MPYGKFDDVLAGDVVSWQDLSGNRHSAVVLVANKTRVTMVQDNQVLLTVARERFERRSPVVVRRPFDPRKAGHPAAAWASDEADAIEAQAEELAEKRRRRSQKAG
jgi:hypothetical protein